MVTTLIDPPIANWIITKILIYRYSQSYFIYNSNHSIIILKISMHTIFNVNREFHFFSNILSIVATQIISKFLSTRSINFSSRKKNPRIFMPGDYHERTTRGSSSGSSGLHFAFSFNLQSAIHSNLSKSELAKVGQAAPRSFPQTRPRREEEQRKRGHVSKSGGKEGSRFKWRKDSWLTREGAFD